MNQVTGITLRLTVLPEDWARSEDTLYIGIYGEGVGREFPVLVGEKSSSHPPELSPGVESTITWGSPCCGAEGTPATDSVGPWTANNPEYYNPLDLGDITYAYLRKASDRSFDDTLALSDAELTICAGSTVRRFRSKVGAMFFGREFGQIHYLPEVPAPACKVEVRWTEVTIKAGRKQAGSKWEFTANDVQWSPDGKMKPGPSTDETGYPNRPVLTRMIAGCCDAERLVSFDVVARERDWPTKDDVGRGTITLPFRCGESREDSVEVKVQGVGKKSSKVTFVFETTSECID